MRVIEQSEFVDDLGNVTLENRIRGTVAHGLEWHSLMQGQKIVTQRLTKNLENDYVLIRNALLPGTPLRIPLILVGPTAVRVMLASPVRGVFRARGDEWLEFSSRIQRSRRAHPDLLAKVQSRAEALLAYLRSQGFGLPQVEPILIFTNPRTHVDTNKPTVRIVLADAIEHFAGNLKQLTPIMDEQDIEEIVASITNPQLPEGVIAPQPMGAVLGSLEAAISSDVLHPIEERAKPLASSSAARRLRMSTQQWVLLAVLFFAELVILILFAMIILANPFG
jgi:hypothetical protein